MVHYYSSFALKVQHNLAQGSASLKLRITNDELRMAGFCFSPCKGNTQQPNVKRWAKPIKNGHDPKVMPVVFIGGVPCLAPYKRHLIVSRHDMFSPHHCRQRGAGDTYLRGTKRCLRVFLPLLIPQKQP